VPAVAAGTNRWIRADAAISASILLLGCFLSIAGAGLVERWSTSGAPQQSPDVDDILGALANAAGLAVVAWWIVSMILATSAAVLEKVGKKRAAAAVGIFCPGFMRRLAMAALSVQLLSAPVAGAVQPPAGPASVPAQEVAVSAAWHPTGEDPRQAPELQPHWRPHAPVIDPGLVAAQPVRAAQSISQAPGEVTVLAGDTLWDIAARELGPAATDVDVALHWPRWYQANKATIGQNPDVLLPGQILKSPSAA
jgi:nucleoid-associated protein YgaU